MIGGGEGVVNVYLGEVIGRHDKYHWMFGVLPESVGLHLFSSSLNFSLEFKKMRKDRLHLNIRSSSLLVRSEERLPREAEFLRYFLVFVHLLLPESHFLQ